jgi:hypothetical protein
LQDEANSGTSVYGQWFYLLSATSGDKTFTATFSPAVNSPEIFVTEVRRASGTWALDAQNTGSGSSNSALSGTINASTDSFVFGGYGPSGTGEILSATKINAVEAFQPPYTPQDGAIWYRTLTAAFTGGAASATMGGSAGWVCDIIAFKAGGTTYTVTGTLDSYLQKVFTKTPTLDALLNKADLTKTVTADAYLQMIVTRSATLDAILLGTILKTVGADALLKRSG